MRVADVSSFVLVAPDKFRGTVTAAEAAGAMARGAAALGWTTREIPLADGGEGLLEALRPGDGQRHAVEVEGPLGSPVTAGWLRLGTVAVVEMAQASGLLLVGGAEGNDPLRASTRGTGQLIVAAARALANSPSSAASGGDGSEGNDAGGTVVVGLGGSATTDGGSGALAAIEEAGGLGGVALVGACDVDVSFVDAAPRFGPQKGADATQVAALTERLEELADRYHDRYGVDVRSVPGAGAAGGLGGAIVALGGRLRSGFEVVSDLLGFGDALADSRLVVTGEGAFDDTSLLGKVVGSVLRDAGAIGIPVVVIAGQVSAGAAESAAASGATVVSLTERFGRERAFGDTARCIEEAMATVLATGDFDS
jgi:glycerate 2-kinase